VGWARPGCESGRPSARRPLADLTLKAVSSDANCTTERVAEKLGLPLPGTDTLLLHLYREKFIEIRGTEGYGRHRYGMLDRGWERAHRLFDVSSYTGPAPISLGAYTSMSEAQEAVRPPVAPEAVRAALNHLVLSESTLQTLGLVASSRRSLFLMGPPGSGKTLSFDDTSPGAQVEEPAHFSRHVLVSESPPHGARTGAQPSPITTFAPAVEPVVTVCGDGDLQGQPRAGFVTHWVETFRAAA